VDTPFRSTELRTGVLATNARPEYGAAYRAACARTVANAGRRGAA
jgi:2-oxoglutarate ferredoxin oxidoreductase subunit beta